VIDRYLGVRKAIYRLFSSRCHLASYPLVAFLILRCCLLAARVVGGRLPGQNARPGLVALQESILVGLRCNEPKLRVQVHQVIITIAINGKRSYIISGVIAYSQSGCFNSFIRYSVNSYTVMEY
jgi:hypothetical protein